MSINNKSQRILHKIRKRKKLTPAQLEKFLAQVFMNRTIISLSHGDFLVDIGGVETVIKRESIYTIEQGSNYLNVFPSKHANTFADDKQVNLIFNGRHYGSCDFDLLIRKLENEAVNPSNISLVLHTLQGHHSDSVIKLCNIVSARGGKVSAWTHDYFLACNGYKLLKNDTHFCNVPPVNSIDCVECQYGSARETHYAQAKQIIDHADRVFCPSRRARETIIKAFPESSSKFDVSPLINMTGIKLRRIAAERPLRVAFLGRAEYPKGFHIFVEMAERCFDDQNLEFYHFSKSMNKEISQDKLSRKIKWVPVSVTIDNLKAMENAIRDHDIDVALVLSIWPETFNIVMCEALLGGACVWTINGSGNPADTLKDSEFGRCFENSKELHHALLEYAVSPSYKKVIVGDDFKWNDPPIYK